MFISHSFSVARVLHMFPTRLSFSEIKATVSGIHFDISHITIESIVTTKSSLVPGFLTGQLISLADC